MLFYFTLQLYRDRFLSSSLICEKPCKAAAPVPHKPTPDLANRPMVPTSSTFTSPRPSSSSKSSSIPNTVRNGVDNDLEKPSAPSHFNSKFCKVCKRSVVNKRFITYENGEIVCGECEMLTKRPERVTSAHMIACSVCNQTVRGGKYVTEPNVTIFLYFKLKFNCLKFKLDIFFQLKRFLFVFS